MSTRKQFLDVAKSELEIDLGEIAFMRRNGKGTDITLNTGQTLTVRESPKVQPCRNYLASGVPQTGWGSAVALSHCILKSTVASSRVAV